jgi:tetratricopeptide (TPR) repeat protein
MVCPYCNGHPLPNSPFCNHCGIIFKLAKRAQKPKPVKKKANPLLPIFGAIIGAAIFGVIGYLLAKLHSDGSPTTVITDAIAAAVVGAILGYILVIARVTILRSQLTGRRNHLQSEVNKIEKERQERLAEIVGKPTDPNSKIVISHMSALQPDQRMDLANEYLIMGHVEEAIQQLEQVYRQAKTATVEFLNNCGVAFARRGQFQVAVDRFQQATNVAPERVEPRVNLLHSIASTRDRTSIADLLSSQNGNIETLLNLPSGVNHLSFVYAVSGSPDKAEKLLESNVSQHPRDAELRNDLGVVKALDNRLKDSLNEFNQALINDPGEACAVANLGLVYHTQGRTEEALQLFAQAVEIDPHNAKLRSLYGAALCKQNYVNEGIREFRESRTHDSSLYESNYNLGKVYIENGILDQAEHCLTRASEVNPFSWQTLVAQAVLFFKQNRVEMAIESYRLAHQAHPDEPIVLGGLALCMALQGDYEQASVLLKRSLESNLKDPDQLNNYAWFYLIQNDIANAVEHLDVIISSINNQHPYACANMGLCQHEMGAFDTAEQYFKTALAGDPDIHTIHYNMGCNYISQKRENEAIKAWEAGKKVEGGNADLHGNLGVAYYKKEQFDKAATEFRRVLNLRQESAIDYANLGLALARMKRYRDAIEQFELGIQIDENNAMLHSNLGLACYFAGRVEDAVQQWRIVSLVNKAYFLRRSSKQEKEYDDTSIDYVALYPQERAVYTAPKVPDFVMNYVPSYSASQLNLIIDSSELNTLRKLRTDITTIERRIRATRT